MVGLYLAWVESVLVAGLWIVDKSLQPTLLYTIIIIALIFCFTSAGMVVYLTIYKPWFLYNPQDYTPEVQSRLFEKNMGDEQNPATSENIESLPNVTKNHIIPKSEGGV